ncbi:MAG: AbrB/MazE/SpoVT family DNA-binding domain-containing protein [Rhizobium sp.]|uniref:AbrB/MazE/SpoVT family DNA-binding domain-containing protein n=1 Tax=Agrobacterium sp. MA01 TaxID=2664893 RepID=UPI00129A8098|nr:AbrB/MazE/SpoVT family DNA-binding domain-containing protein [Agrobacterium sp. MA01]MDM7979529.1 AbrB/MazE/SpoVT family DNA-binding domain-containing protein [Rhizobium sp.]MDM8013799.1 AbrB/MazE/SpoVT family DNA-binding domain-containing protein [Rhizobium sp.]QGG91483.1 AbrB/MazE/SpoVT family DNA-binding domain-containing protein [Agrobacterium sp. MA01]
MRVTSKGQVTIPRDLRELIGIEPNSEVVFTVEDGRLMLTPKNGAEAQQEKMRLAGLMEALARLEGTGDPEINADTLMQMTRDR